MFDALNSQIKQLNKEKQELIYKADRSHDSKCRGRMSNGLFGSRNFKIKSFEQVNRDV